MPKLKTKPQVVQVSITMDRELKQKYAKLAVHLDLSFSQLVRYALRRVADGVADYESTVKSSKQRVP